MLKAERAGALLAVLLLAACSSVTPSPSSIPSPSPGVAQPPESFAAPTLVPSPTPSGSLAIQTLLFGDRASFVRWSPGGSYIAAVVPNMGATDHGGVRVYSADGHRLVGTFAGTEVAWLDDETLAVQQELGDGWRVIIRSLGPYPDVILPSTIQNMVGDQLAHAVVSGAAPIDGSNPRQWLLGHWTANARGDQGYWSELPLTVAGSAGAWSPDGRFLALAAPVPPPTGMAALMSWHGQTGDGVAGEVTPAAPGYQINRLILLRIPSEAVVPTPSDLTWDVSGGWSFSPKGDLLAGVVEDGSTTILDTASGRVRKRFRNLFPIGWAPFGDLILQANGEKEDVELWDPDSGALTMTGLTGFPSFGPARGEVTYVDDSALHVGMADRSEVVPILSDTPVGQIAWSPDGSAVVVSDLDYQLLRISAP